MRPPGSQPNSTQAITVLEILDGLDREHGEGGVPFKALEHAARQRMDYRALTASLNTLVSSGAVLRVSETPARLRLTEAGRKQLGEYRD